MSKLTDKEITLLESFIEKNKVHRFPDISYRHYDKMKSLYREIKAAENNYLYSFAYDSNGMTQYHYYKTSDGQIYVISTWIGTPYSFSNVDDSVLTMD